MLSGVIPILSEAPCRRHSDCASYNHGERENVKQVERRLTVPKVDFGGLSRTCLASSRDEFHAFEILDGL